MRVIQTNLIVGFLILLTATAAFAQTSAGVDPAFAPEITSQGGIVNVSLKLQSDGKLLVFSPAIVNHVARLNTDGSRDTSFNCTACGSLTVVNIAVQPDGKILVAGTNTETKIPSIIRVNADGSADASFSNSAFQSTANFMRMTVYGVQADGKIYIGLIQNAAVPGNFGTTTIFRLNADGSVDNTFNQILNQDSTPGFSTINLKVLADGRVFVYGKDNVYGPIAQLNPNGSKNTAFESPVLGNNGNPGNAVNDIALQADGKIVFVGNFQTVNGQSRNTVARLNADGTLDLGFSPTSLYGMFGGREASTVDILPNGKILIGSSNTTRKPTRLNADGTIDTTYNPPTTDIYEIGKLVVDSLGRAYIYAGFSNSGYRLVRLTADGALDSDYNPDPGAVGGITALAVQSDGKIIVGGVFNKVNGVVENTITRLNADGTTDVSFNAGTGFNGAIKDIAVQTNGKIVVVGGFINFNGSTRGYAARLNADGSLDTSFNVSISTLNQSVNAAAVQSDGKFLIGGQIAVLINGISHTAILRYNADGSLDGAFNPAFQQDGKINDLLVQSDGKIMAVGTFAGVNGVNRTNIVRLNADGTTDTSFNAAVNSAPLQILQQTDGKYLIRTNVNIYRLNANGSLDGSFMLAGGTAFYLETMSLQPNDAIVIGGSFDSIAGQPRRKIARLLPSGNLDVLYAPRSADNTVLTSLTQADGKVIVGGQFTNIGGVNRFGIARLTAISVVSPSRFDFDGDGKADVSVFRPANGFWYVQGSRNGFSGIQFGASTDRLAPADYDGDGKTDFAVFRDGIWYLLRSSGGFLGAAFGQAGDVPQPADLDGDGRAELVVWRPSNGTWYVWNLFNDQRRAVQFGAAADKPVIADYDGDGKADYAVVRQSGGASIWYILGSTQGFYGLQFGTDTDKPVAADYDGDGKTDIAVFRPSSGTWYLNRSSAGFTGVQFGIATDSPVAADYDGDGKADLAVFRASDSNWYVLQSTTNSVTTTTFGTSTDKPIPSAFTP